MRQINRQIGIEQLRPIALAAGDAVKAIYAKGMVEIRHKENATPATEADLAAHRLLASRPPPLLPDCHVVSEEDAGSLTHRQEQDRLWRIDPLDGIKEFFARNGVFTINTALIEDGRCVPGVAYAPAIDALYWGGAGLGAFRCIRGETGAINVSAADADRPRRVVASKSHLNPETQSPIDRLGAVSLVQAGSSLKFCRVAEGEADISPRLAPTCESDTAAAQAVLEGAGGPVLDRQGQPLRCAKPNELNPSFIAARDKALIPA